MVMTMLAIIVVVTMVLILFPAIINIVRSSFYTPDHLLDYIECEVFNGFVGSSSTNNNAHKNAHNNTSGNISNNTPDDDDTDSSSSNDNNNNHGTFGHGPGYLLFQ